MIRSLFLTTVLALIVCACQKTVTDSAKEEKLSWGVYRGFSSGTALTEADVKALSETGANLIRLAMATEPFIALDSPHVYDEQAFTYLDSVLNWSERYGVSVVVDPHLYPGMGFPWTMLDVDPFWRDTTYQDLVVNFWEEMARRYAHRGDELAAYDLLNEPALGHVFTDSTLRWDINPLYKRLIAAIRKHDTTHWVSVAAPRFKTDTGVVGYAGGMKLLGAFDDDKLVYQIHFYSPQDFTHQGVFGRNIQTEYPDTISGEYWDEQQIARYMQPALEVADSLGVPVYVGEFSVPRWVPTGNAYLKDVIEYMEAQGWSWTYHSFRESHIWDAEMNPHERADSLHRIPTTPRLEMLKSYFNKN